jgi:LmbE family N-acetylglucosaminyl deacetylase
MLQWRAALKALGIKNQIGWNLPDIFEKRLPIDFMVDQLLALPTPKAVYTHSIIGDYGHPHHQDVSMAVHHAFYKKAPVWSLAYNCAPDKTLVLTKKHFEKKTKILSEIYFSETQRFSHFLPAHFQENFAKLSYEEVKEIYSYFLRGEKIDSKKIKKYRWYLPYLAHLRAKLQARPF